MNTDELIEEIKYKIAHAKTRGDLDRLKSIVTKYNILFSIDQLSTIQFCLETTSDRFTRIKKYYGEGLYGTIN